MGELLWVGKTVFPKVHLSVGSSLQPILSFAARIQPLLVRGRSHGGIGIQGEQQRCSIPEPHESQLPPQCWIWSSLDQPSSPRWDLSQWWCGGSRGWPPHSPGWKLWCQILNWQVISSLWDIHGVGEEWLRRLHRWYRSSSQGSFFSWVGTSSSGTMRSLQHCDACWCY